MVEEEEATLVLERIASSIGKQRREDDDIATWLDRWYLPRPVFEDGEPVQFGDEFVEPNGSEQTLNVLSYTEDGIDYVSLNGYGRRPIDEPVKRPAPKVLDADGVPIEVGDTVWGIISGNKLVVATLKEDGFIGQDGIVRAGELYTHREPDSLEKLRDDIAEWRADYTLPDSEWGIKMADWLDRLDAIIERGA